MDAISGTGDPRLIALLQRLEVSPVNITFYPDNEPRSTSGGAIESNHQLVLVPTLRLQRRGGALPCALSTNFKGLSGAASQFDSPFDSVLLTLAADNELITEFVHNHDADASIQEMNRQFIAAQRQAGESWPNPEFLAAKGTHGHSTQRTTMLTARLKTAHGAVLEYHA